MKSTIFGAYDIRGRYPKEINEQIILEALPATLKFLSRRGAIKKIVIGHDARLSSPKLYKTITRGLLNNKIKLEVIRAGMITTPMMYFLVNRLKTDGGIMVTASHNPKNWNGLKIVGREALPVSGKEIYGLYKSLR